MSAVETAPWKRRWARRWSRSREARWGYGLTSIWLVGFLVFSAVPLGMSVYISFTNWAPISGPFWQDQATVQQVTSKACADVKSQGLLG